MADTVAKLYAELGFNVNQTQLKTVQDTLDKLAAKMSAFNEATKKAAQEYGIFSKEQRQQELNDAKIATENEKAENLREKRKLNVRKQAFKEQVTLYKLEQQENKKHYNEMARNSRAFFREISNLAKEAKRVVGLGGKALGLGWLAGNTAIQFMRPSMERAYDFENFMFESGMNLSQFQKEQRAFVSSGVRMSQKDLISEMLNVQRNLTNVALNRGGDLAAYKLMDVRAGALRGDLNAVLGGIRKAVQEGRLDHSMLGQVLSMFGFQHTQEWGRRILANPMDNPRTAATMLSETQRGEVVSSFEQLLIKTAFAFENLRDQITWGLSPTIKSFSEGLQLWFEELAISIKNGEFDTLFMAIKKGADELLDWLKNPENIKSVINGFKEGASNLIEAIKSFKEIIDTIAQKMGLYKEKIKYGAIIGGAGALSGAIAGAPGGPVGMAAGAIIGGSISAYGGAKLVEYEYNKRKPTMNDVVDAYTSNPATTGIIKNITFNDYVNTTLNGLTDEEQKKSFEDVVTNTLDANKRLQDRIFVRDNNILFLNGEAVQ